MMRLVQTQLRVNFEVQFNEELRTEFVGRKLVNRESQPLGHGADSLEEMFFGSRARLDVNHDVGRDDLSDAALDGVADRVRLLEAGRSWHADRDVDKVA